MEQIEVRILDRDFRLAVAPDEKGRVLEAVRMVDERMRAVRDAGRVSGVDRIAVMAALQIAHQMIGAPEAQVGASRRLRELARRVDADLAALSEPAGASSEPSAAPSEPATAPS